MLQTLLIIIIAILLILSYMENNRLRHKYFNLLKKNKDFKDDIDSIIESSNNELESAKLINKKYDIGILKSKELITEFHAKDNK